LVLESVGRRSGEPRRSPLIYLERPDGYVVCASNGGHPEHPAWWLNLEAHPRAIVHVGGQQVSVVAREVLGKERAQLWKELVDLYDGLVAYQEGTTRILPVVFLAKSGKSPP
jgi:deazaflavin-dependent oxidoreductase (nitroreductase family)